MDNQEEIIAQFSKLTGRKLEIGDNYIKVDGVFTIVEIIKNIYHYHGLKSNKQLYLITDGDNHWAYGNTLREADANLVCGINNREAKVVKVAKIDTRRLWISNSEAAKYLGVSKDWLKERRENGTLHYAVVGNTIFYIKKEIDRLIANNAISGISLFKETLRTK